MTLKDISSLIKNLQPINGTELTNYVLESLTIGERNCKLSHLLTYLKECDAKLIVTDWLGDTYTINDTSDAHTLLKELLKKYNGKITEIKTAYDKDSFSTQMFVSMVNYFKCEVAIT